MKRDEAYVIPRDINYNSESLNLSFEEREKLMAVQPQTVSFSKKMVGAVIMLFYCSRLQLQAEYQE